MFSSRQSSSWRCLAPCGVSCPQPCVDAWSQPCVTSCGDSRAVIHPPPVVITFPGPILSSCPQESLVGSSVPCLGSGNFQGSGNFLASGASYGSYGYGRSYSSYGSSGFGSGSCRPC
ncbi:scale keratin-like [Prinia subflava]|uniref:scale keratin-like n=1 Tax=Prinia subflava TaxID=208062 RepID=UPI002FE0A2A0